MYFFWKCSRFNQFLWDVFPKIRFPFPPFTLAAGLISVVLTILPFSLPVLLRVSKYRGEAQNKVSMKGWEFQTSGVAVLV